MLTSFHSLNCPDSTIGDSSCNLQEQLRNVIAAAKVLGFMNPLAILNAVCICMLYNLPLQVWQKLVRS